MGTDESRTVVTCPNCGKQFNVRTEQLGKRAKCRGCGEPFELQPALDMAEPEYEEPVAPPSPPVRERPVPRSPFASQKPASKGAGESLVKKVLSVIVIVISLAIIIGLGVLRISNQANRRANLTKMIEDKQRELHDAEIDAANAKARAKEAAKPPPPPPEVKQAPQLVFTTDAVGRRVGTAKAAMRSAATTVKLVLPPGDHPDHSLPCVFVCPAGSNLLTGTAWDKGEQEDFYGLLDRGMAVCFYSLDGTLPESLKTQELAVGMAIRAFLGSGGGLGNAQDAIDTVLASTPSIDPSRLGAIGHSSAGTVGLTAAAGDPRIVAVAAMAPAIDLPKRLADVVEQLDGRSTATVYKMSPSAIEKLTADVYIYQASDDTNVPAADASAFAAKHADKVKLELVPTGGHGGAYTDGRPKAFDFLATRFNATPIPGAGKNATATAKPAPASAAAPVEAPVRSPSGVPSTRDTGTNASAVPVRPAPPVNQAFRVAKTHSIDLQLGPPVEGMKLGYVAKKEAFSYLTGTSTEAARWGVRGFSVEVDATPRLKFIDPSRADANDGLGYIADDKTCSLPKTEPRTVEAFGGKAAVYEFDDKQMGQDTHEAIVACEAEGSVLLIHVFFPKPDAAKVGGMINAFADWTINKPKGAVAKPYTKTAGVR